MVYSCCSMSFLVRSLTHLYFLKCENTQGSFPTSSSQVQANTTGTGKCKTNAESRESGMAIHHMQTARLMASKRMSPPE